jgi:seryl-tRNA synthetase
VDDVIAADATWRDKRWELDNVNSEFNKANKAVSKLKVAKEDATEAIAAVQAIKERMATIAEEEKAAEAAVNALLCKIGNLVHDSVPVSDDEENNVVYRSFGLDSKRTEEGLPNHVDLIAMLDIADTERGTDVAGGRGYFLKGAGVLLNQAMINYAIAFLAARGHTPLATPFFMRKDRMAECAQLADFDEQLYKVSGEGDDKYLIATSEQTCCSYLRKRWIQPKELPMRFAGYSTCFRKEAGSHGRDTLGIFRVHQFEKVEQFVAVSPDGEDSWEEMERLLANSEAFYQSLGIPYHVVNIVSGELNDAAAKKYDLEAWFPSSKTFRELVSCSNCTDFQSRRLEVRCGAPGKGPEKKKSYVHLLNSTLTATERSLCCLIENWQTPEGLVVPPALRPYMCGIEFVPFVKKLDKKGRLVDVAPPPKPLFTPEHDAAEEGAKTAGEMIAAMNLGE